METKIIDFFDKKLFEVTIETLFHGGVVVYPTETSYGLGVDATNRHAIKKIYRIKQRPTNKNISFAVSDIKMANDFFGIDEETKKLAKTFMPGPLTIVTKQGNAFRIPDNEKMLKLIKAFGRPITATSANISGDENIYKIKKITEIFDKKVDVIIDAGDLPHRQTSTVFDVTEKKILRSGPITLKQIMEALK